MTTTAELNVFLDSIIQNANYLRNIVDIPENADFRDMLMVSLKEADSVLDDCSSEVNDFDESEWS